MTVKDELKHIYEVILNELIGVKCTVSSVCWVNKEDKIVEGEAVVRVRKVLDDLVYGGYKVLVNPQNRDEFKILMPDAYKVLDMEISVTYKNNTFDLQITDNEGNLIIPFKKLCEELCYKL